ncbi:hypothetical protein AAC387_Pa01g0766 [Persea americana]
MVEHIQTQNNDILSLLEEDFKKPDPDMERHWRSILERVRRPAIKILSVVSRNDWGFLECSRMAKYVAEEAIKSKQYDVVLWIDPVKGRDIATATTEEEEEEQDDEEEDENTALKERAAMIIYELMNRKLKPLLVIECGRTIINVGFLYPDLLIEAKFVVMSRPNAEPQFLGLKVDETVNKNNFLMEARSCISEMLVMEARGVADSLRMNHHITLELNTILYCITYLLLMPNSQGRVSEEELSRYYMGEGLIPLIGDGEEKDMNIDRASAITKALLTEIVSHTIFKFDQFGTEAENKDIYVQMDDYLWEALRREEYQHRLGIASTPEEMRGSNCKWISLAMKNIETLPLTPPSCPAVTTLLLFGNLEMKSIPDHFFEHMTSLRVLDLSLTALTSLPSSISNCCKLEQLFLKGCQSLETLPPYVFRFEKLQVFDISECTVRPWAKRNSFYHAKS